MNKQRWQQIENIMNEAINLGRGARTTFLEEACRRDPELVAEVRSLLDAAEADDSFDEFLEEPVMGKPVFLAELLEKPEYAWVGDVDGYELKKAIGEGGMGSVFLAEQSKPIRRQVAMKVIRPGLNSNEVLERFSLERQVLSQMKHAHIAHVYEAGTTSTGNPFFTMEYCAGYSLTRWCREHESSIPERLNLFLQACEGVRHAHRKAVVHRDMKPSNLMVTEQDGKPTVKVIDFGIARVIGGATQTMQTRNVMIGTPAYMSPEQADGEVFDTDTRCDVYGLGAVLFELLAGMPPFDPKRLLGQSSITETIRIIREEEPVRPSQRIAEPFEGYEEPLGSKQMCLALQGDLDWIVMKCLAKDREERYGSVEDLMEDIRAYLEDRPVKAAPPGWIYKARKLIKRKKMLLVACMLSVFALFGVALASYSQWQAEINRGRYRATLDLFMGVLDSPADMTLGPNTPIIRLFENAALLLETGQVEQPAVAMPLHGVIGRVFMSLGKYEIARKHLNKAMLIGIDIRASNDEILELTERIATLRYLEGDYEGAARDFEDKLTKKEYTRVFKKHPALKAEFKNGLANCLVMLGSLEEAGQHYSDSLDIQEELFGVDGVQSLKTSFGYGTLCRMRGEFSRAEYYLRLSYEGLLAHYGSLHPWTQTAQNNLANLLADLGLLVEARKLYELGYQLRLDVFGPNHPGTLESLHGLCYTNVELGNNMEAEQLCGEAYAGRYEIYGSDHMETLKSQNNLGLVLTNLEKFDQAEALYENLTKKQISQLGLDHVETLASLNNYANLLVVRNRGEEAESILCDVINMKTEKLGGYHPDTLISKCTLAEALIQQDLHAEALPWLKECMDGSIHMDPKAPLRLIYQGLYALCLTKTKDMRGVGLLRDTIQYFPTDSGFYKLFDQALEETTFKVTRLDQAR